MTKSLQEIADSLRDRLIYMDGLGDIGTARHDQVLALAHNVQAMLVNQIAQQLLFDRMAVLTDRLAERLDRLERIYLPQSDKAQ